MRACAGVLVLATAAACAARGGGRGPATPWAARPLPTLADGSIHPGKRLRLVGRWGRAVFAGQGAHDVAFFPDGKTAVAAGAELVVFEAATRRVLRRLAGHEHSIGRVAVSPDGAVIATGGYVDRTIVFWNAATGAKLRTIELAERPGSNQQVSGLAFSPDGRRVFVSRYDQRLSAFDTATGDVSWEDAVRDEGAGPFHIAVSGDGTLVAGAAGMAGVAVWEAATGKRLWDSKQPSEAVAFQGSKLLVGSFDAVAIAVRDARTGKAEATRSAARLGSVVALATAQGRSDLFVGAEHGSAVTIWDQPGSHPMYGHLDGLHGVAISSDGALAASVSTFDGVRVWDLRRRCEVAFDGHEGMVLALGPSADGALLTSIGNDGSVLVWDLAAGAVRARRSGDRAPITAATFSADGATALLTTEVPDWWPDITGPGVYVVDAASARERAALPVRFLPATALSLSADGGTGTVFSGQVWESHDLRRRSQARPIFDAVDRATDKLSTNVRRAVTLAGGDMVIGTGSAGRTWHHGDYEHPGVVARLHGADGQKVWAADGGIVTALALSRDERMLLAGNRAGEIHLLDPGTGRIRWSNDIYGESGARLWGGGGAVLALAFSPDGRLAAAADGGGHLLVWSTDSGHVLDVVRMTPATALAFSADGRRLFAADATGMIFGFEL